MKLKYWKNSPNKQKTGFSKGTIKLREEGKFPLPSDLGVKQKPLNQKGSNNDNLCKRYICIKNARIKALWAKIMKRGSAQWLTHSQERRKERKWEDIVIDGRPLNCIQSDLNIMQNTFSWHFLNRYSFSLGSDR